MKRKLGLSVLGSILIASSLIGCRADRVDGIRTTPAFESERPLKTGEHSCAFSVSDITDKRGVEDLGQVIGVLVDGKGFKNWLSDGVRAIPGHTSANAPVALKIEILKAHIHAISTHKSANIILRVQATGPGTSQTTKIYRGVDGSVNWNGSESEIQTAFDLALVDLKRQISADLSLLCKR